jgi:hypothetical protein
MFHHRLLVGIAVCSGLLSSSRLGQAAPGVGPEFALTSEPQEFPEWYAPAARGETALTTPSGHVVTIYPCAYYPCPVLGQDIVRVLDVTTMPARPSPREASPRRSPAPSPRRSAEWTIASSSPSLSSAS